MLLQWCCLGWAPADTSLDGPVTMRGGFWCRCSVGELAYRSAAFVFEVNDGQIVNVLPDAFVAL